MRMKKNVRFRNKNRIEKIRNHLRKLSRGVMPKMRSLEALVMTGEGEGEIYYSETSLPVKGALALGKWLATKKGA